MSQTLDQKALEAAILAIDKKRPAMENPTYLSMGAIAEAAITAYLAALPPPKGDVGELVERLRGARARFGLPGFHHAEGEPHSQFVFDVLGEAIRALSRQLPAPTGEVVAPVAWTSDYVLDMLKEGREVNALLVPASDKAHGIALYASPVVASAKAPNENPKESK